MCDFLLPMLLQPLYLQHSQGPHVFNKVVFLLLKLSLNELKSNLGLKWCFDHVATSFLSGK